VTEARAKLRATEATLSAEVGKGKVGNDLLTAPGRALLAAVDLECQVLQD
jgi:hypothetical protein